MLRPLLRPLLRPASAARLGPLRRPSSPVRFLRTRRGDEGEGARHPIPSPEDPDGWIPPPRPLGGDRGRGGSGAVEEEEVEEVEVEAQAQALEAAAVRRARRRVRLGGREGEKRGKMEHMDRGEGRRIGLTLSDVGGLGGLPHDLEEMEVEGGAGEEEEEEEEEGTAATGVFGVGEYVARVMAQAEAEAVAAEPEDGGGRDVPDAAREREELRFLEEEILRMEAEEEKAADADADPMPPGASCRAIPPASPSTMPCTSLPPTG